MRSQRNRSENIGHSSIASPIIFLLINTATIQASSPDVAFYNEAHYNGSPHLLKIGQSIQLHSNNNDPCISFKVLNATAAILVTILDKVNGATGQYENMYFYSEVDQPFVGGTDQYCNRNLEIKCLQRGALPQPEIFIPVDFTNVHPNATPLPQQLVAGHRMLVLRRAFFWENSEDLGGLHGPYGDIKVNVCDPIVMRYSYEQLVSDESLWQAGKRRHRVSTLPGPIYTAEVFGPNPHSEWIDGPWGCYYSNLGVWDWGQNPAQEDSVAIIISEADVMNPDDMMGAMVISSRMQGPILMKVRMFGWVILENIDATGPEPSVDIAANYLYEGWDGAYPERVRGPENHSLGSQYVPYHDARDVEASVPACSRVGLLGAKVPNVTASNKIDYVRTDQRAAPVR